ncbi:MAG: roadblock/LC7 domain-containing protein [Vulcanisaeta sp. AZ3]|jgi:predicted regulator of Ras-like GTPase activity (Roadblock/LC7/MglB family)
MQDTAGKISKVIKDFLNNTEVIDGVYVSSLDGLLVAHASRIDVDPDKVAAMITSISAVGDRVSKELLDEESTYVIVQAHTGYVIVRRQDNLIFSILVRAMDDAIMGFALLAFERLLDTIRNLK